MLLRSVALGGLLACAMAPVAMAECPQDTLQLLANRYFAVGDTSLDPEPVSKAILADAAACQDDPYAQKIASMAQVQIAIRTQANREVALEHAGEAYRLYQDMVRVMPKSATSRIVMNNAGRSVSIQLNDSYEIMKSALTTLLTLEAATGKLSKHTPRPPKAGDPPIACDVYVSGLAQQTAFWIGDNGETPGASNILSGLIANCTGNEHNRTVARANRAGALLKLAKKADKTAPATMDLVRRIYADSDAIFAFNPKGAYSNWDEMDLRELDTLTFSVVSAQGLTLPVDKWFTPDNFGKPLTRAMMAAAIDAAYAKDMTVAGGANTYAAYRGVLTPAFNAAKALPEARAREARKLLYKAAKDHADGKMRAPANTGLKKPSDWLYNWIDPDYVPPKPATPAPAASAPAPVTPAPAPPQ